MVADSKEKLWTRTFVLLTVVQTMDLLAFNTITPVIAKYTIQQGVLIAASGLAASVFSMASIFARPLSGFLSDRLGRRPIVLVSIAVSALMQFGYAVVPGFGPLLALRIVHGFFYALFGTAISAMAIASLPESRISEGMGWFGLSYVVASIIGPAMGVAISDSVGFTVMFLVTALVSTASFPLALIATSGQKRTLAAGEAGGDGANRKARKLPRLDELVSPRCIPLAGIVFCFMCSWAMVASYIVLVGESRGVQGVALFFFANSLTLMLTRPLIGKLTDRLGLDKLIVPAVLIETCAFLGICLAHQLWVFLASASIKAFGSGGVLPSIQAECGKLETPERAGVAMSTYHLAGDIGYAVGPIIGGMLASTVGYEYLFFGTLPITALALAIYLVWRVRR